MPERENRPSKIDFSDMVLDIVVGGGALLYHGLRLAFAISTSKPVIDYFTREKLDLNLLEKLNITILSINKVMDDAEHKETTDQSVKEWLDALKHAVYDTEDLLDVISSLDHAYKVKTTFNHLTSKLRPSWNPFDVPVVQEINNVFAKLQFLLQQKDALGLKESNRSTSRLDMLIRHPTTSLLVEESCVYGRDTEKESLKKLLLSDNESNAGSVIAIIGMGGLGKTTLAQLIFNDKEIDGVFKLNKVWISVSEDFDVIRITKTILENLTSQSYDTNNFDKLQMKLRETLSGKMYLIVLDDVWNENYMNWDNLRSPFECGALGSKIVVTTRSEKVASVMRAISTYKLNPLSHESCWLLFAKHAFENVESSAYSTFQVLGRKLVKKCGGLPLAAKVLGGLVGTKLGYQEWNDVLTSDIWDLSNEASGNILSVLRLSYHYLPSNLKRCFAFCSIVPKDFDFEREKLVMLWMAENLLQDYESKKRIDVGYEYLRDLESRSLIQPSRLGGDLYFSMHDLVNDLAKSVSGEFYNSFDLGEKTRHFSYVMTSDDYEDPTRFKGVYKAKRLRTFLPLLPLESTWKKVMQSPLVPLEIWPQLNVLRSLTLASASIRKLPDSIGNLKLLRYLDLSANDELNQLPESLASLYNLEVLNLSGCESLTKLPSKLRQLTRLNHLDITDTTSLQEMPLQMGSLKELCVLTDFVLGKGRGSFIGELKELKALRGDLSIRGLQNIVHPKDALVANLKEKSYLEKLSLEWDIDSDNSEDARIILDNLRPHVNLKKLYIYKYSGKTLPDWYHSLVNLVCIEVSDLKHCFDLSPLGRISSLKTLTIRSCDSLVTLVGTEIPVELPNEIHHHVGYFSALVNLFISWCPKLELPQHQCFTSIEDFTLDGTSCGSLQFFPLCKFQTLKRLRLNSTSIESLALIDEANSTNLEYLEAIKIVDCPNFEYFNTRKWCAPKMTYLCLLNCESLKILPENMCNVFPSLSHLELTQCPNLEALPQSGLPGNLRHLEIKGCNKLIANRSRRQRLLSLSTFEESFLEGLLPSSLSFLCIEDVPDLTNLNGKSFQLLTSLKTLELCNFPKLHCLPELPTTLSTLRISNCPLLESRCQGEQGEDWSKIAHIPNIEVYPRGACSDHDILQDALCQHDDIAEGTATSTAGPPTQLPPLVNVNHEDEDEEDDLTQLARRSARESSDELTRKPSGAQNEVGPASPFLPPSPPSTKPTVIGAGSIDYITGDVYKSEETATSAGSPTDQLPLFENVNDEDEESEDGWDQLAVLICNSIKI